jgi:hypothetical protein
MCETIQGMPDASKTAVSQPKSSRQPGGRIRLSLWGGESPCNQARKSPLLYGLYAGFVDDSQSNGRFVYQSRIAIVKIKALLLSP